MNYHVAGRLPPIARWGQRGYLATRILLQVGYSAVNVGGGYETYKLFHHSIRLSTSGIS